MNRTLLLAVTLGLVTPAHASLSIAEIPVGVRQIYKDGTAAELLCPPMPDELTKCTFRIFRRGEERTFEIIAGKHRLNGLFLDFTYWSYSEYEFGVAVDVECPVYELERLSRSERVGAKCRLWLKERDGKLVTEERGIEIFVQEAQE